MLAKFEAHLAHAADTVRLAQGEGTLLARHSLHDKQYPDD